MIETTAGLLTKGNIFYSTLAYYFAMVNNIGVSVLLLAVAGLIIFLFTPLRYISQRKKLLFVVFLAAPIFFNILALHLGFSIINLPELGWNPSGTTQGQWFNVRYGILALPFAAVLFGIFAAWRKLAVVLALQIILLQACLFYFYGIITVVDGTVGSSAFRNGAVANALMSEVKPDETVLMSISVFNPVAFRSNIQLKQIVHEGVSQKWQSALLEPELYADWIVVGGAANSGDPVRQAVIDSGHLSLPAYYEKVYSDNEASIYRLKDKGTLIYRLGKG
jgi:hypothetical protein